VGSVRPGETFTVLSSLINTAKLNCVDPRLWLADVLDRIVTGRVTSKQMETLFVGLEGRTPGMADHGWLRGITQNSRVAV
jgi:hypothetical protein